jgi:signal transduction histidine kinase
MRRARWASDTIARWFAINIVMTVVVCAALNASFIQFAGVWAKPGLDDIGLIDEAAAIERMLDHVAPAMRPALAAAACNPRYTVAWFPEAALMSVPLRNNVFHRGSGTRIQALLGRRDVRMVGSEPGDLASDGRPRSDYALAIALSDGSWVQFIAPERSWGLKPWLRNLMIAFFVLVSSVLVAAFASRRLARPMERFARAAQRFGADVQAPPMVPEGPREFRAAIHAFNDMQDRVQRYVADRTDMLAAISHDLRAPLTRMRLRGEFIEDDEQQRKLFRDVDEMRAMVDASLGFFREDGQHEEPTRFNLTELVHTVLDDVRDAQGDASFTGDAAVIYVGRPLAFRRAIANVLDNAVKYGRRAHVSLRTMGHEIHLVVDDEGPGIAAALHETVFRPFYRIEPSRNRRTGGVGLGLGIARSTMRAHGGDIVLGNREPHGLRVTMLLPAPPP